MTRAEFAARLKSKYPDYGSMSDDDLVAKVLAKYPEYAKQIDDGVSASPAHASAAPERRGPPGPMGMYGGVPGDQFDLEQPLLERFGQAMTQGVVDYHKPAIAAMRGEPQADPTSLAGKMGQIGTDIGIGGFKAAVGTGADVAGLLGASVSPDLAEATQPENTAQQVGQFGERMAEFAIPATKIGQLSKAAGVGRLGSAGIDIAGNVGLAAGIDYVHGEDPETMKADAAIAGAIPLVGHSLGAMTRGLGKRVIDSFFPKTTREKKLRISPKGTSDVLNDEGIRGLRGQTLIQNIDDTIDNAESAVANMVVTSADTASPATRVVFPRIQTIFNRGRAVAKAQNSGGESIKIIDDGLKSIEEQVTRLTGNIVLNAPMSARQLNNLRRHVGTMLNAAPPNNPTYKRTLLDAYAAVSQGLERVAPGVRTQLSRIKHMIGTKDAIATKLAKLEAKEPITATDIATGVGGFALGPLTGTAATTAKLAHKAYQYSPGRMIVGRGLQSLGEIPGRTMFGAYMGAADTNDPAGPVAPRSQMAPQAPTLPDPKEQAHFSSSLPVVSAFDAQIEKAASQANVDPLLLKALIIQESGTLGPTAKSNKNAIGLTQVTKPALEDLGMQDYDMSDPEVQLLAGAKYLRRMLDNYNGNAALALAAYNAGPGAVNRHKGVPPFKETQAYVPRVLRFYAALGGTRDQTPVAGS